VTWGSRRAQRVKDNGEQATLLGIEAGEPLIRLVRQRLVDGSPVILDFALVPHHHCLALATAETR
jgi:DNA-binding GntR family transcriptional regulator